MIIKILIVKTITIITTLTILTRKTTTMMTVVISRTIQ